MGTSDTTLRRRAADDRYATRWLVGRGLDLGVSPTQFDAARAVFPRMEACEPWQSLDADPVLLSRIADDTYDFVHAQDLLARVPQAAVALGNWIRVCRPGGHLVLTVPDEDRFEQGRFPSTFEPNHAATFTINKARSWSPRSFNLFDLLRTFADQIEILRLEVLDAGYRYTHDRQDQRAAGAAEAAIEVVLRKLRRPARTATAARPPVQILLRRRWAMGDIILATALIDRILATYGSDAAIDVATAMPHVLTGTPHIRQINPPDLHYADYDRVIDLDGTYEANRSVHAIDAYMIAAFGDANWPRKETVLRQDAPRLAVAIDWRRAIVLHAGIRDRNRTMPRAFWEALIALLLRGGYLPVLVGTSDDNRWRDRPEIVDLCNNATVQETAWIIARAACFFSLDTGVAHIAGTTDTPMVTLFTSVRPQNRMRWRHGVCGWRVTPLTPDLDCIGCHSGPCPLGHYACTESDKAVTAETVYAAIVAALQAPAAPTPPAMAATESAPVAAPRPAAGLTFIGSSR